MKKKSIVEGERTKGSIGALYQSKQAAVSSKSFQRLFDTVKPYEEQINKLWGQHGLEIKAFRRVSTTLRQVSAKFSEFFMCWGFPQKKFAPGSPGSDDLQLGRPTVSPLLSFFKRISHFQS